MDATCVFIPERVIDRFKNIAEEHSRLCYCFKKTSMSVPPLNLSESLSKTGDMHNFMRPGVEVEVIYLIGFRVMRSNDSVTTAADVFLSVSDHKTSFNS